VKIEVYIGRGLSNRAFKKITSEIITVWVDDQIVYDSRIPRDSEE